MQTPIQVIQLDLAEGQFAAVSIQKAFDNGAAAVGGKAEVLDPALLLLLDQILNDRIFGIGKPIDITLTNIMTKIKIEVIGLAVFQLLLENGCGFFHVFHIKAGILCGQEIAVSGVLT